MPESRTTAPPKDIRVHKSTRQFEFDWGEDGVHTVPFRQVRIGCRCAFCVDEHTGKRLLNPDSIPDDIGIINLELVGNYALRIHWTDQHASGLFTWTHLQELCHSHQ